MPRSKLVLAALLIVAFLCPVARADQVTLKDGDRLSAHIIKSDGKTLVMKSELAGEVSLAWDSSTQISSGSPVHLMLADDRGVSGIVSTNGDQISVKPSGAAAIETQVQAC